MPGQGSGTSRTNSSADKIGVLLESGDHPPQRRDLAGRDIDVFVSGHTHAPALSGVPREAVVVNSGCWLRQLRPVPARYSGPPVYVR